MFHKILVAVDETEGAQKALKVATNLAQHYHSALCLLHAFPHVSDYLGSPTYDQLVQSRTLSGQELLDEAQGEILATMGDDVLVDTHLIEGAPATAILRVAATEGADLIVMGSRGHSAMVNLLLGSVSTAVSQQAHCPVMVIH